MSEIRGSIASVVATGLLVMACGGGGGGGGGGNGGPSGPGDDLPDGDVTLTGTTFQPENLTVDRGTTVVWVNSVTVLHSITPDGHAEFSRVEVNQRGDTFQATFDEAGTFEYFCEFHGAPGVGMHGTITVRP